ncbi:MAG: hypothetical protein ABIT71_15550 [Vicinamibacteraceae bacterium]
MLSVNSYPKAFVDACRTRIDDQVAAYRALLKAAGTSARKTAGKAAGADAGVAAAAARFEPPFFGHLVIALDAGFMHRSRTLEQKDGNAMNEVRMLSASLVQHGGILAADKTIKYDPATSVLKVKVGDPITIDQAGFVRLAAAYFAAIAATFQGP